MANIGDLIEELSGEVDVAAVLSPAVTKAEDAGSPRRTRVACATVYELEPTTHGFWRQGVVRLRPSSPPRIPHASILGPARQRQLQLGASSPGPVAKRENEPERRVSRPWPVV
ncbi:hypothetical protein HPB52_018255 [Rhipicephalus sanguineus]|uniref:Uncharacterized protein n=1 Tax=Rhipicephalus sanguineus TaxID=34632 RepID=A0A9D4PYA4_RHISA|nr:hypothetical protein HPB52_018255 [Rhipicephalus sanguineus]